MPGGWRRLADGMRPAPSNPDPRAVATLPDPGTRAGERVLLEAASCEARRADTGTVRLSPVEARGSIAISRRDQPISGMVTAIFATRLLRVLRSL